MIDHISLRVSDYDRAVAFFKAALAPLGFRLEMEFPGYAGFGAPGKPELWVTPSDNPINPTHVAFRAERAMVDAFFAAAVAAGGKDNGGPGLRPDYHPNYYGAFVLDPDGNNIEACSHAPPAAKAPKAKPTARAKAKVKAKAKAAPTAKAKAAPKPKAKAKGARATTKKRR
jgi:catechol 2,3-dioxygenase-like lactoylglutathione lyase family enzyme